MQRTKSYTKDLTQTSRSGEFNCPGCGIEISPDDKTEDTYEIVEIVTKSDCLKKLVLRCKKCGSRIQLIGFDFVTKRVS